MKSATWPAFFVALPLLVCGTGWARANGSGQASQEQSTPAANQAPGSVIVPTQGEGHAVTSASPADPGKMAEAPKSPAPAADQSYVIGAEDQLGITVWGDTRLGGAVVVRPDGRISMNLIGEFTVAGLTPSQVEQRVADLLKQKQILNNPQVSVQVTEIRSKKYFLQGEVNHTGAFPLVVPTTILEALVNAGGFRDFANEKKIEVIRGKERFRFNYKDVIKGKHTEQNIFLKPGDIIIVP